MQEGDWDLSFKRFDLTRFKDIIIPEVSRVSHFNSAGIHVNGYESTAHFEKIAMNQDPWIRIQNIQE